MRRERWIAVLLIAGAVSIGALAGCGQKAQDKDDEDIMAGAPTTTATTDTAKAGEVSMAVGEQVVQANCVLCHGQSGKGDGPGGAALNPKPRDWTDHAYMGTRTNDQLYEVIYNVLEDVNNALVGMLKPEYEEVVTGDAEVREVFSVPRVGRVAGCFVTNGVITRGSKVRFLRDGVVIWKGAITSLRRFKDDVREVREGFECGIGLSDFQDLKAGDIIETFEERLIPRS